MRFAVIFAALLGLALGGPVQHGETFENHHIIDVDVKTPDEAKYFYDLEAVGNLGIDIWLSPHVNKSGRVRVPPENVDLFLDLMSRAGIHTTVKHTNLRLLAEQELADQARKDKAAGPYADFSEGFVDHTQYHSFSSMDNFMSQFAQNGATKTYLPYNTYEGRSIPMIEITGGTGSNKINIFIEAGVHAREWVGPSSALYFIDRMLSRRGVDQDATDLYNNYNWFIIPCSNPDGYEYSRLTYRYWRKNRVRYSQCGSSVGVDLNRNFDAAWGGSGSSGSCSSDTYRGPSAFSESESLNIHDKVNSLSSQYPLDAYLSVHSYSQLLLVPYNYARNTYPSNNQQIRDITWAAEAAMFADSGLRYEVGSAADILYNADGGSTDWARLDSKAGIRYTMTYELRPGRNQGLNGFNLPASQIRPAGKEFWESMKAIAAGLPA